MNEQTQAGGRKKEIQTQQNATGMAAPTTTTTSTGNVGPLGS